MDKNCETCNFIDTDEIKCWCILTGEIIYQTHNNICNNWKCYCEK